MTKHHLIWLGDEDRQALVDERRGLIHATIWHDGYDKFYPTLYLSPWTRALWSMRHEGCQWSLACFPRISCAVFRFKSVDQAMAYVEDKLDGA